MENINPSNILTAFEAGSGLKSYHLGLLLTAFALAVVAIAVAYLLLKQKPERRSDWIHTKKLVTSLIVFITFYVFVSWFW